jgi:hypothetical protein
MTDDGWCISAAVIGADKYPELSRMIPKRPAAATDCSACSGAGEFPTQMPLEALNSFREKTGFKFRESCGKCHGLGWSE